MRENKGMSYFILGLVVALALALLGSNLPAFGDNIYGPTEEYLGRSDERGYIYDRLERPLGRTDHSGGCND